MRNRMIISSCVVLTALLLFYQRAEPQNADETIKEAVKPSIERGVEFLMRTQLRNGAWQYLGQGDPTASPQVVGATALCGIALMESGIVDVKDSHVQAAANVVRNAVSSPNFSYNYGLCLCLLFLDRLNRGAVNNQHRDRAGVLAIAERIARGQCADGGWSYDVPPRGPSDNSNTQFAVVALWVARKYNPKGGGLIDKALSLSEKKFRGSQRGDGGWGYDAANAMIAQNSTGSMTCAGILGIALHAGARGTVSNTAFRGAGSSGQTDFYSELNKDPAVAKARDFILQSFREYLSGSAKEGHTTYFLWSLERVATLYKWRKINDVDWFELGARFLMKTQLREGAWNLDGMLHGPQVDTAFALLFLAKSNLLGALTEATLTGDGSIAGGAKIEPKKPQPKEVNVEQRAKELAEQLLTALPNKQAEILEELTTGRGVAYAIALADIIPKLDTNAKKEAAREALANRFSRMTTKSLTENLTIEDREVRLASAVAVRLKNDIGAAGGLIPLLADQDIGVSTAALDALKHISGQDFGKSVERWSRWLEKASEKKP